MEGKEKHILLSIETNAVNSCEVKIDTENADTDDILASVATLLRELMSKVELPYHLWKVMLLLAYSGANMQEDEE